MSVKLRSSPLLPSQHRVGKGRKSGSPLLLLGCFASSTSPAASSLLPGSRRLLEQPPSGKFQILWGNTPRGAVALLSLHWGILQKG